ncbi:MAG: LysR family transcriptional regulator [Opitutales bacterium]
MEFHQLRYFVEVARQRNFSRAAEHCHVSQPSLSQQIQKLEDELGQPLFTRTRLGAVLTPFGEATLPRAEAILNGAANLLEEADAQQGEVRGTLRVGAIPTIAPYLLPGLVRCSLERYPELNLEISEEVTAGLVAHLRNGELDFVILSPPFLGQDATAIEPLGDDELLVALPPDHALTRPRRLSLEKLAQEPMIVLKEAHCLGRQSVSLCETSGVHPRVSIQSAQLETVVALVEAGLGFSFLPAMAREAMENRKITLRSVDPKPVSREIVIARPRNGHLSRAGNAFLKLARDLHPA